MTYAAPPITVLTRITQQACTVVVRGEVDLATAPALRDELYKYLTGVAESSLELDLAGVTFLDSAGLHVLVASRRRAALLGRQLVLARTSPQVERILELTGTAALFERRVKAGTADPVVVAT